MMKSMVMNEIIDSIVSLQKKFHFPLIFYHNLNFQFKKKIFHFKCLNKPICSKNRDTINHCSSLEIKHKYQEHFQLIINFIPNRWRKRNKKKF